jgi:dTDP-4-amino-4,6-dideoxygalactose transaminase
MKQNNENWIPYVNLIKQFSEEKKYLLKEIERVLYSGKYILSDEVEKFENAICNYQKNRFCLSVNSGTDAIILSLLSLNISNGDEVITQANSYVASAAAIHSVGAKPVFCDVMDDQTMDPIDMETKINTRTKAIMPVHLTGRMCDMTEIMKVARKHNLKVIEDCAQSIGSVYRKKKSGGFGDLGAFSTHPLKNLNACGDGGFIVTNNKKIADFIKLKRNHGHIDRDNIKFFGTVSRLDAIQAAILNFRLKKLEKVISKRVENAQYYKKLLCNEDIYHPSERSDCRDTYHLFVIQVKNRDDLKKFLLKRKIETNIHYPIPIHKQRAFNKKTNLPNTEEQSKRILSLPINQYISKNEIKRVCNHIIQFVKEN